MQVESGKDEMARKNNEINELRVSFAFFVAMVDHPQSSLPRYSCPFIIVYSPLCRHCRMNFVQHQMPTTH